ncbi:hypothetical protein RhiirA4_481562 [Rhizophagus irregularis]|uniref:Uncharacterized protein n=1 Tax=Rhizophagus irregularis TaxID=588596 RepID=A0A2I1HJP0_9GLOM|nr:hypothetical protein RhiirA4_481562 [Rhizophagus irregularis]
MNTIINKEGIIYEEDLIAELDKKRFISISVYQIYNIPNHGRDKGPIAREVQSNKRKKDDNCDDKNDKENNNTLTNLNFNELEYQEKKLTLKEREISFKRTRNKNPYI